MTDPHFEPSLSYQNYQRNIASGLPVSTAGIPYTSRPAERVKPQRLSFNALPAFEFNPSGLSDTPSTDSSHTPTHTPPCSNFITSHRRNGSELIGGDPENATAASWSKSPTKPEFPSVLHASDRKGPTTGRRGHAHRRSGAVASTDLSEISAPSSESHVSSLPATPSNPSDQYRFPLGSEESAPRPEPSSSGFHSFQMPENSDSDWLKCQPRARVGFSDTLEYIPRPLSTISTDTSSSLSTVRASLTKAEIVSSTSAGGSSSTFTEKDEVLFDDINLDQSVRSMHSTSQSIEDGQVRGEKWVKCDHSLQEHVLPPMPGAQISPNSSSPHSIRSTQDCDANNAGIAVSDIPSPHKHSSSTSLRVLAQMQREKSQPRASSIRRPRSSPEPKIKKQPEKVRSWAGSFLTGKSGRPQTVHVSTALGADSIPLTSFASADNVSSEHFNFDDDSTCVIRDASHISPSLPVQNSEGNREQVDPIVSDDSDNFATMLDLDAAFESPISPNFAFNSKDNTEHGFCAARRRMHSGGVTGGFSGPGMHYHRRSESAPEMAPIDYHAFGFPRFGSNPKMADVFEEEEEEVVDGRGTYDRRDAWQGSKHSTATGLISQEVASIGLGVSTCDRDRCPKETSCDQNKACASPVCPPLDLTTPETETGDRATSGIRGGGSDNPTNITVEIAETDEEPRSSAKSRPCSDDTMGPTSPSKAMFTRPISAPLDFALPDANTLTLASGTPSNTPSPEYSKISFDMPRLYTANSSVTDGTTLNSNRAGEHNFNFHASAEDVPSLTSSASSMTNVQPSRVSGSIYTRQSAERSSSFSAALPPSIHPNTSSKRSSLASFSRLVGHSYGERSKLNIEERVSPEGVEKTEKKKGSRINRLIRFWKLRERPSLS